MESPLKERLVGAIILVLLVVLVVPALLSGRGGPQPPEPAAPSAATRSVEISLGGQRAEDAVDTAVIAEPALPEPTAVREAPTGLPDTDEPIAVREAPTGLPDADEPAAVAAPALPPEEPPLQAAAPAVAEATVPSGAGWAVQVAALANRAAALQQVAELTRHGYAAFILEYRNGGRVLYRVRVGPEATRERAAALAERLKREGVEANVVSHP